MLALLEDLLAMAYMEDLDHPQEEVDVRELVETVCLDLGQPLSPFSRLKIEQLPSVLLPETFLVQIFSNLIGNALRYSGEGPAIEIGGERTGSSVLYFVRDHGVGIPQEERERIFEVFYRGATGKDVKGTGLGLAIVGKIAKLAEGRAWAEETPGGGSTFFVEVIDAVAPGRSGDTSGDAA